MDHCAQCGSPVGGAGYTGLGQTYCSTACRDQAMNFDVTESYSAQDLASHLEAFHQSDCPNCGGPGPIDIHHSHTVYSVLVMTSWKSNPKLCCRKCAIKSQLGAVVMSGVCGWWGFPWGLIMTPVQIVRNFYSMATGPKGDAPSPELQSFVYANIDRS